MRIMSLSFLVLLVIVNLHSSFGDDPGKCAEELVQWCKKQDFSSHKIYSSSTNHNGETFLLSCIQNGMNGMECKKDLCTWFECSAKNVALFKGKVLSASTKDKEICVAKEKILHLIGEDKESSEQVKHLTNVVEHTDVYDKEDIDDYMRYLNIVYALDYSEDYDYSDLYFMNPGII